MPVYLKRNLQKDTLLGVWEITETPDMLLRKIGLNDDEEKQYCGFRNDTRRMQWLSYRVLLKELISDEEYSHVIYDEFGKPYLQFNSHHLSVSHSGKYSAAIVSRHFPVGIDIEIIHPKIEKVIYKFLSDTEINNIGIASRLEQLYVCWGAKESLYKLYGEKNLLFQEHIWLHPFDYVGKGVFCAEINTGKFQKEYAVRYEKLDDYMLVYTVAS
ncbi:MAG: 4'-phosphopantetheinyl transferase superfamily protein [Bacteroidota bacterium]